MIYGLRNTDPVIDFGYGLNAITVAVGQSFQVWQNTIYRGGYESVIYAIGSDAIKVSDFQFVVSYDAPGAYEVYVQTSTPDKSKTMVSNTITVTVE